MRKNRKYCSIEKIYSFLSEFMSEIRYSWVEEQVWALKDKTPNDRSWISNSLTQMRNKTITNAQDVFVVQNALKSLGYNPGKLDGVYRNADKKYNSETMMAVREFQKDNNIQVDGQAGPETIGKLLEKLWTNTVVEKVPEKRKSETVAPKEKKSKPEEKIPEEKIPEEKKKVEEKKKEEKVKILQENATKVSTLKSELIKSQDGKLLDGEVSSLDMAGKLSSQELGNSIYFDGSIKNGEMITWTLYSTKWRFTGTFKDNKPFDGFTVKKDGNSSTYKNGHFVTKNHEQVEEKKDINKQPLTSEDVPKKKPTANLEVNKKPAIIQHPNKTEGMKEFEDKGVSVKNGVVMKNNEPLTGIVKSIKLWGKNTIPWLGSNLSFFWKVENGEPTEWTLSSKNESFIGVLRQGSPFEGTIVGNNNLVLGYYKQWKLEVVPVLLEETRKNFAVKNGIILRGGKPFTWTVEALEPKEGKLVIEDLGLVKDFVGSIRDGKLEQWTCFLDENTRFTGTFRNGKPLDWDVEWLTGGIMNEFKDGKSMFKLYNMT